MANRATNNPPQHVASTLVAGQYAIGYQESRRTQVICNHPQGFVLCIGGAQLTRGGIDQGSEQIDLVVRVHVLQYCGNALETHAGINRWRRQRVQLTLRVAVVLHEHQIPNFNITIQIVVFTAWRPTRHVRTVVVKNLGAGPARSGVTHLPKIVLIQPRESGGVYADFIDPYLCRLIISDVHSDP